jgi:hypothetical protein
MDEVRIRQGLRDWVMEHATHVPDGGINDSTLLLA